MIKTIGLFAHVDAGKTTFAEQLLYLTRAIAEPGRVDHRSAFLDSHEIEQERGITVFADQATFAYKDHIYHLIDTPGHVDFSPEMERTIQVMDAAIIIVSAVEGVEGHTETVWQLLKKQHVPVFFFINKTDRTGANLDEVVAQIRSLFTTDLFLLPATQVAEEWSTEQIEFVAERDSLLLEAYLERGIDEFRWRQALSMMVMERSVFPLGSGSALHHHGIEPFFAMLDGLVMTSYDPTEPFAAQVYKIRYDAAGTRMTFLKVRSGSLQVRGTISYKHNDNEYTEKVTQIRSINGKQLKQVERAAAGELCAVAGLTMAACGQGGGALSSQTAVELIPALKSKVILEPSVHPKDALKVFRMLDDEDPSLSVSWEERTQDIHLHVMGVIQLEVLERIVLERFQLKIRFGEPQILYKETIGDAVAGCGHFEPLKHYAEVHLRIEPGPRDSGIVFLNACHPDVLPVNYQHLVEQHIHEREHHGLLTGSPLTDLHITLLKGRAHNKHTHGGDFREATFRAIRQGLEQAENILLEPIYDYKIRVALDHMGRVLSDIQQAHGSFQPPEIEGDKVTVTGRVPVATFMNYSVELASFTQGKGRLSLMLGGYEPCHQSEQVIEAIGYQKQADPEYTSSSIFCAKGQGYEVPWEEAAGHMHV
ncbi:GTP-binding protein [Paenibacillus aquistagni]|uniref:Small GTP-binding protein domain-containing protein n=1 Tax=Paenibacillus aquistagni TaxID=1852522 RepID=A0A1X7IJR3_9BACL|nr:TetM/TetW/TetO/TetS family tetracycline resistance ribosomal protection protein [Paenibacillus aquistagni]SMG14644.1 small GTP-binding protein domain-containing protein [Paenibacillus aquistagni]